MSSTVWHSQFVFPGACIRGDVVTCVLEKSVCPRGTQYRSPRQILDAMNGLADGDRSIVGAECMPDPGKSSTLAIMEMIDNVKIGRCANAVDKNICTGTPESCMQPASFVESVDSCRLHDDLTIQSPIANAQFGKCGGRCVWDDSDCRGQPFSPAKSVSGDECYCEDVEVGACQAPNNGQYYCAVSPKACDSASTFVKTSQLPSSVSCKLTEGGLQRTVSYKVMSHSSMTISSNVFTSSHEKNIGLVVGLTFGGIAALVACILVGRCILGKNKRPGKNVSNSKEDTSFETSPVPESNLPYVA